MFRKKRQRKWLPLAVAMVFGSFSLVSPMAPMGVISAQAAEPEVLVVVDAGHYTGYNPGVAGYTEGDWSMRQARADKEALESYGFAVLLTRDEAGNPGLYDRGQMAVRAGQSGKYAAVVFMSDHTDACEYDSTVSGVSAITSAHLSNSNMQLIQSVMQSVADEMNYVTGVTGIRGIETRMNPDGTDYYGVLRGAVSGVTSPSEAANGSVQYAFILEHGFHTSPAECLYMTTDSHIQAVAQAKARAFAEFFGKTAGKSEQVSVQNQTTSVFADVPCTPWTGTVRISGDTLNLRSTPDSDTGNNIICRLGDGNRITVLSETANQKYGDLWYYVQAGDQRGYVHSTWIMPDQIAGNAVVQSWTSVYADLSGRIRLQSCPDLGQGNQVQVLGRRVAEDGSNWYAIRIADRYVGYVPVANLLFN